MSYKDWKYCVEEKDGQRVDEQAAKTLFDQGLGVMAAVVRLINL